MLFQGFTYPVRAHYLEDVLEMTGYKLTSFNQVDDYGQEKLWKTQRQLVPRKRKNQITTLVEVLVWQHILRISCVKHLDFVMSEDFLSLGSCYSLSICRGCCLKLDYKNQYINLSYAWSLLSNMIKVNLFIYTSNCLDADTQFCIEMATEEILLC